jgi:hypothetical protein
VRGSHVRFVAPVAAVLTCGSLTDALANGKVHGQTSHLPSWHAERYFGHGWGWDPSVGYYEGPIWGRKGKGYFRCLDPSLAGILARSMECCQSGIECWPTSGSIVGHDTDEPRLRHANSMFTNELFSSAIDGLAGKNQPHFALC